MKIMVLGGNGKFGKVLIHDLIGKGHTVININRHSFQTHESHNVTSLICDRRDHKQISAVIMQNKNIESIIDLSGFRSEDVRVCLSAISNSDTNYFYMSSLAAPFEENKIFVPIDEIPYKTRNSQKSSYGHEKLLSENLILDFPKGFNGRRIIFRTSEIIGVCDSREKYFLHRILSNQKEILLPDGGNNLIHPIDARDLSRAIILAVEKTNIPSGIFHVAGKYALTLKNYISTLITTLKLNQPNLISVPYDFIKCFYPFFYFPFFPRSTYVSSSKLYSFGYKPQYSITDSIIRCKRIFSNTEDKKEEKIYQASPKKNFLSINDEEKIINGWKEIIEGIS